MINELLLIFSVVFIYGMAVLGYALFGKAGLYCISAVATILANIEALILVNAFSMEQTLGMCFCGNIFDYGHSLGM